MATSERYRRTDHYEPTGETYGPTNAPVYVKNCRKYIKISSGGECRYLLYPDNIGVPNVQCTSLMEEEWDKLLEKSKLPTMEQRKQMAEEMTALKFQKTEEAAERKKAMQAMLEHTEKTRKMNAVEKEKEFKRKYTIRRANQLLLDETDSMREFNQMIALKKCIATWDQQVMEKEKIKQEEKQEKKRQEREAEIKRNEEMKQAELARVKEKQKQQNFIKSLGEQIKEREVQVEVESARQTLARQRFNKAAKQGQDDEITFFDEKAKADAKTRVEQHRVNVLLQRLQAVDKEEDIIFFDKQRKLAEEQSKLNEDKDALDKEIEMKRKEELQKMVDQKIKTEEEAKFKDLMEEVLRLDNSERSWRQKELLEQREKKRGLDEMYAELERQVVKNRLSKAQIIEEERKEICKIAKDNIEDEYKDNEVERKIKIGEQKHRTEILLQINDTERRKIKERADKDLEGKFIKIQEEKRIEQARDGMLERIGQVRKDNLPLKYVRDLEEWVYENYGGKK